METRRTLQRVSAATGIDVNWRSANAIAMLAAIRETPRSIPWRTRVAFQWRTFRYLWRDMAGLSVRKMLSFVMRKIVLGQNYLDLSHEPVPRPFSRTPLQAVQEAGTSQ